MFSSYFLRSRSIYFLLLLYEGEESNSTDYVAPYIDDRISTFTSAV
jgi:hypothetical protein